MELSLAVERPVELPLAGRKEARLDGIRVLVVDDHDEVRAAIAATLIESGAEVMATGDGLAALAAVRQRWADVLVSDIAMPGMDGHELIRQIRRLGIARGGNVPALALTAYASQRDRTRALLEGFQVYLAKPFEPEELIALVADLAGVTPRGTPVADS
ncbi:MAG TPA: response regulator [Solirubrobacteraceae bacterium]|jgi:CheY-like chemotaxis protein